MALRLKTTHNLAAHLTPDPDFPAYHEVIGVMVNSQYHTALTITPPLHLDALQQFWANATVTKVGTTTPLKSTVNGKRSRSPLKLSHWLLIFKTFLLR